jgi:ABC-2 type transport system permease protein
LLAVIAYGLVIAVSAGLLMLALSSLSRNSRYVALLWLGIWFISGIVSNVLIGVNTYMQNADLLQTRSGWRSEEFVSRQLAASRTDWTPLLSYRANLARIGQQLLGSDASWERISQLRPLRQRNEFLNDQLGPQFPWYWSAAVLAALGGLSICILHFAIRSLDRLK